MRIVLRFIKVLCSVLHTHTHTFIFRGALDKRAEPEANRGRECEPQPRVHLGDGGLFPREQRGSNTTQNLETTLKPHPSRTSQSSPVVLPQVASGAVYGIMPGAMAMALLPTISGWSKNFTRTCSGNIDFDTLPRALPVRVPTPLVAVTRQPNSPST